MKVITKLTKEPERKSVLKSQPKGINMISEDDFETIEREIND